MSSKDAIKLTARQSHARIVSQLNSLILRIKRKQSHNRSERLLPSNQHLPIRTGDDGRLEEIPIIPLTALQLLTAHQKLPAVLLRILDLRQGLVETPLRRHRPHGRLIIASMAHDESLRLLRQNLRELVVHALLHVHAVGRDARLPGVSPLERHELRGRLVEVRVVEHEERTVAAQLQRALLQPVRADLRHQLAHPRAAGERHFLDQRVAAERFAELRRVVETRCEHAENAFLEPSLLGEIREREHGEWSLGRGLDDHRAARRERRARFAQDHGDGEVPGHERDGDADGLLDGEDAAVRGGGRLHRALHALRLAGEPPGETQGVVELALRFEQGLARLVGHDLRQVVAVLADQGVPFQKALGARARVDLAEGLEGRVRGLHGGVDVFCCVVWCCCPDFTVAGVCWEVLVVKMVAGS